MAHLQIHAQTSFAASAASGTQYTNPLNFGSTWVTFEDQGAQVPVSVAGTMRNLAIRAPSAPGSGNAWVFTFRVAGSDTALLATIADDEVVGSLVGTDVSVPADSEISIKLTMTGSPGALPVGTRFSMEWEPASGNASIYGYASQGLFGTGSVDIAPFADAPSFASTDPYSLIAAPGVAPPLTVRWEAAPGVGKSRTLVYVLDDVEQDGTGGTPDTRATASDTDTTATGVASVTLVRGQRLLVRHSSSGSPGFSRLRFGTVVIADVEGESTVAGTTHGGALTDGVFNVLPANARVWTATETDVETDGAITPSSFAKPIVALDTPPGDGDAWVFTVRRNQATPVDGPVVTITGAGASGPVSGLASGEDLVGLVEITSSDTAAFMVTASGFPTSTVAHWGIVQFTGALTETFSLERALRGEDVALAWVEYDGQDDDGNDQTFVWSGIALADPDTYYGGFKAARLILISDLILALSDRFGRVQATKATFELSDFPDANGQRSIAAFFGRTSGYVPRNTPITIRLISDRGRRALRTPVTIFRGVVDEAASLDPYRIRFDCVSWLARRLDQPVVERLIREDFLEAPETVRDRPVPLLLGRHSDESSDVTPPVITQDEAGVADFFDANRATWVPGYGSLGGNPPTSVTPSEDAGNGSIPAGRYYIQAWSIDASGNASDPEPFDPHDLTIDVSDNAKIDVPFTKGAGAATTRVAIGQPGTGSANTLIYFHHILETAGTSVSFTKFVDYVGASRLGTDDDITPGGILPYGIRFRGIAVTAVVGGIETAPTPLQLYQDPYNRPFRFALEEVTGATAYAAYLGADGEYLPPNARFTKRLEVPIQLNGNGDPYVEAFWNSADWESVTGLQNQTSGVVALSFVGYFTDLTGRTVGGFLVAAHTLAETVTINLYQDGQVIPASAYSAGDVMAPGKTGFSTYIGTDSYRTINGSRYTLVYLAIGARLTGAMDGTHPLVGNFYGADAVGDGTGAEVTSKYAQMLLLLRNLLAPSVPVLGTNWNTTSPTFPDGVAMIDEASFTDAEAAAGVLVPSGPDGGRYLSQLMTWSQLFPDWCPSAKALIGVTLEGQVRVVVINPDGDVATTVTEAHEIIRNSFTWRDRVQGFANAVEYTAVPTYDLSGAADYRVGPATLEHTVSQTRHRGERTVEPTVLTLTWVRDSGSARQVAQAYLDESAYLPREVRQASVLHWVHRSLGDLIGVVHREGADIEGWTESRPRKHGVLGMRISIPANTVEYTCVDLRTYVGDLSPFTLGVLMGVIPLGGSLETPCIEDTDVGSPALVAPPDWRIGVVNWDQIPSGAAGVGWEVVFDVDVKILPASPVGSPAPTVQPALYLSTDDQNDTPVATGTASSSAIRERQQIVVDRPVGSGFKEYRMLPILANGALFDEAYMYGVLRLREIGSEP